MGDECFFDLTLLMYVGWHDCFGYTIYIIERMCYVSYNQATVKTEYKILRQLCYVSIIRITVCLNLPKDGYTTFLNRISMRIEWSTICRTRRKLYISSIYLGPRCYSSIWRKNG